MEGRRNACERTLSRGYESNRLEEDVWAMVYEQLWPLLRRSLNGRRPAANALERSKAQPVAAARRA